MPEHVGILPTGHLKILPPGFCVMPCRRKHWPVLQDYRADFPLLCADDFSGILGYLLLSSSATQLAQTADSSPEFANRMRNQLPYYTSFCSFASRLKSKEMTLTRINRILLHSILGITSSDYACGNALDKIPYLRILGFRESAAPLLAALKASAAVPLITRPSQAPKAFVPGCHAGI